MDRKERERNWFNWSIECGVSSVIPGGQQVSPQSRQTDPTSFGTYFVTLGLLFFSADRAIVLLTG